MSVLGTLFHMHRLLKEAITLLELQCLEQPGPANLAGLLLLLRRDGCKMKLVPNTMPISSNILRL